MSLQIVIGVKKNEEPTVLTYSDSSGGELSPNFSMFDLPGDWDNIFLINCETLTVKKRSTTTISVWVKPE